MTRAHGRSRAVVALIIVFGVLAVLMASLTTFAGFWTDRLWYRSVHYGSVFSTMTWTRVGLFAVFGLLMAGSVAGNMYLAHRLRPPLSAMSHEQQNLDRCRMGLAPYRGWVVLAVCGVLGIIGGGAAAGQWRQWLLMSHSTPFHTKDPQFHKDVSFYTFQLPWYRFLVAYGFAVVILSLLAATLVHYLYGGLRLTAPGTRATRAATGHLAVLLGLFTALKAAAYWLDRYALVVRSSGYRGTGSWTGLRYVDANAHLPAKTILCFIALICALLFFATAWLRTWTLPTVGFGLLVLSAILVGGLYPAIVQKFEVQPNEAAKEAPYVQKNVDATRAAYGLTGVRTSTAEAAAKPSDTTLGNEAKSKANPGVLDPNVVSSSFQELQQNGDYYQFPSTLDVDRQGSGRDEQATVVGVRELNVNGIPKNTWINDHFKYTHGYGLVSADGTKADGEGAPVFAGQDASGAYRRQIYFGEDMRQYSIVGGSTPEVDHPDAGGEQQTHYQGKDGVSLRDPLTRAAYAVSFGEPRIFYSSAIGKDSKILYNRTPKERVAAVAPWLTVDGDPYPVELGGKVLWVVDGYTTSDSYPYASRTTIGDATADSLTDGRRTVLAQQRQVNYIRNSVKATVDAYDGTVTLYQWDTADPVLKTWMKAFPHTVKARADIPADLLAHLRYPQDLFKVQREVLTSYHVTTAADFSGGGQQWAVPDDPAAKGGKAVPPYYMSLQMPGQGAKSYSLTSTFTPSGGSGVSAYMAVDADATSADYGTIRLLRMPAGSRAEGLKAAQTAIRAASQSAVKGAAAGAATGAATGARAKDSEAKDGQAKGAGADPAVEYGNLLTVPLDGGLLYVEPVYVRGADDDYPLLAGVGARYGGTTRFAPTLAGALDALFPSATASEDGADASPPGQGDAAVSQALADAQKALADSQAAMKKGDWDASRTAQQRLAAALKRAQAAERSGAGGSAPSTPVSPTTPSTPPTSAAPTTPPPGDGKKG